MKAWHDRVNHNMETGERVEPPPKEWCASCSGSLASCVKWEHGQAALTWVFVGNFIHSTCLLACGNRRRWLQLVRRLRLSPGTLQRMQTADRLYRSKQAVLVAEQQRLSAQLAACLPQLVESPAGSGICATSGNACVPVATSEDGDFARALLYQSHSRPQLLLQVPSAAVDVSDAGCLDEVAAALQGCMRRQTVLLAQHYHHINCQVLTILEGSEVRFGILCLAKICSNPAMSRASPCCFT